MEKKYFSLLLIAVTYIVFNYTLLAQEKVNYDVMSNEKYLILFNPTGTEIYSVGSEVIIEWEFRNVNEISIQYLNENNIWKNLVSNLDASDKKYNWEIGSNLPKLFKLRIIDINDSSVFAVTPYYIEVISKSYNILQKSNIELRHNSNLSKLNIMPLGNSITQGYTFPVPVQRDGYRKRLKLLTENNGLNFDFIGSETNGTFSDPQHEGHGGWHANHWATSPKTLLDSIPQFLTSNLPDIILLHAGTNDIGEYDYPTKINDNSIDTTVTDISKILDAIYNIDPEIFVILSKIVNRIDNPQTSEVNERDTTTALNNALEIMAVSRIANGDNLMLVDMENALIYPDDLCSDGVHPDSNGYHKMANVWFTALKNSLPKLNTKIYLEGAYFTTDSMNVNLGDEASFPKENPFTAAPWNYSGTEKVDTIPNNIVDWVLISLRSDSLESSIVAQRAAFLRSDGQIVDLDGTSPIAFATYEDYYYIVIEHRNHLPIMSNQKVLISP